MTKQHSTLELITAVNLLEKLSKKDLTGSGVFITLTTMEKHPVESHFYLADNFTGFQDMADNIKQTLRIRKASLHREFNEIEKLLLSEKI
jgi:hypothetical protein